MYIVTLRSKLATISIRQGQVKSSLVKRGKEMHEPDRMYLNPSQIVFVETVGTNSKVAQLIAQAPH
jgi:hypothetical protein